MFLKHAAFLLAIFLTSSQLVTAETVFTVAYEDKVQFPYYMGEGSKVLEQKPGAAVELIQLLEAKVDGLKVQLKRYPWQRCLENLKSGEVDGAFNASFKEKRMEMGAYPWKDGKVDPSRRLTTIAYSIYTTEDNGFTWDGSAFSNLDGKIGAPRGYSIVGDLEKLGVQVVEANSTEANLKKLMSKRIKGAALQDVTGDYFVRSKNEFSSVKKLTPALKTKPYYLMISHQFKNKNPELAEKIWAAVADLRETQLTSLADKYFE